MTGIGLEIYDSSTWTWITMITLCYKGKQANEIGVYKCHRQSITLCIFARQFISIPHWVRKPPISKILCVKKVDVRWRECGLTFFFIRIFITLIKTLRREGFLRPEGSMYVYTLVFEFTIKTFLKCTAQPNHSKWNT